MKIQVELNLEDVFEEAMYNEATLKEEFTSSVRLAVIREGDYIPFYDFSVKWYIIT